MSPVAPRTVGIAVVLSASLAAAVGLVVGTFTRPLARRAARAPRFGIHQVPARPALWDARPTGTRPTAVPDPRDTAPVPPENNHAPR